MPELPEVETTVRGLKKVYGKTIVYFWTDSKKFARLKNKIKGKKIQKVWRRGKNIIFQLSGNHFLLIHQKMTGHLLLGEWVKKRNKWESSAGPLSEKVNSYIHLLLRLDNGKYLALSDLRRFAKAEALNKQELEKKLNSLGPEPLEKKFTFEKFKKIISCSRGKIKQVLMDQQVIAGIGNIYSDEILWRAKINPFQDASKLKKEDLLRIYRAMKSVLALAIKLQGTSTSDYRMPSGKKGFYSKKRKVYGLEFKECKRCGKIIKRVKIAGRSAHFCPNCQK